MLTEQETSTTGTGDAGTATTGTGATESAAQATEGTEATTEQAGVSAAQEGTQQTEEFDPERAMATIKNMRAEEKALKAQLREAKAAQEELAKLKAEQMTEAEQKDARLAELEEATAARDYELAELRLGLAVHNLAGKLPIADAEVVLALIDRDTLELDDDGVATNLEKVVLDLLEAKPLLKGQAHAAHGTTDGGAGRREPPPPNLTAEELEAARELGQDPIEYARMKEIKNIRQWQEYTKERAAAAK